MDNAGKLIVIDGLDGSGKTTQFELLKKHFDKEGLDYKAISFPDYNQPSSTLVKMYLSGEFSENADEVNAYAASSFYAVDRYASYKLFWERDYHEGKVIVASRYVSSNAIHQMVKLSEDEWDNYLEWLLDYEYSKMGLPKPCMTIFLDMPVEISQKLLDKRYEGTSSGKDIHEANVAYLLRCRATALYAADKFGWEVIECSDGQKALDVELIHKKLIEKIYGAIL